MKNWLARFGELRQWPTDTSVDDIGKELSQSWRAHQRQLLAAASLAPENPDEISIERDAQMAQHVDFRLRCLGRPDALVKTVDLTAADSHGASWEYSGFRLLLALDMLQNRAARASAGAGGKEAGGVRAIVVFGEHLRSLESDWLEAVLKSHLWAGNRLVLVRGPDDVYPPIEDAGYAEGIGAFSCGRWWHPGGKRRYSSGSR